MSQAGITDAQRNAIVSLAPAMEADTYLAGGAAIALRAKHRISVDVNLFVPREFDAERLAERVTATVPGATVTGRARATLHLADLEDLACMKLSAIAGRGAAKDFWDLDESPVCLCCIAASFRSTTWDTSSEVWPTSETRMPLRFRAV
jgi:hypothetical protein